MSETTGSFKFLTEKDPAWMSDNASTGCVGCGNEFGFFTRRHHCRICGKLFCDVCCNHQLSSQGTTARVCVVCWLEHSEEPKKKHEKALKAKKNVIFSTIGSENQYCMDIILDEFGLYISRQEDTTTTHIFLLDIVFLELQSFDRVTIKYSGGRYFGKNGSPETRTIITHNFKGLLDSTLSAFKLITLGATSLGIDLKGVEEPEIDPPPLVAGGYLHTYRAFCSLLNIRPNRDVEMYVEDSAQQDNRHFVLDNIPGALSRDQTYQGSLVRPVLASLYWNTYYTSLSILGDYKKVDEAVVAQLLGLNQTFTSFQFSGEIHAIGKSPPPAFCNSMIENKGLQITDLDLKGSTISSPFIFKALPNFKNLRRLCLRECHVSQKILEEMFQTFQENPEESSQIEDLDFSSVDFAVPFMASMNLAEKFSDWIVAISPNAKSGHISRLRNINLSKTNMDFSKVLWRFEKLPDLEYLDVSNNKLIGDAAPQLLSFAQSSTIEKLVMQQCEFVSQEKKNLCDVVVNFLRNKNLQPGAASCWVGKNTGLAFEQIPVESIRTETLFHLDLNGIGFSSNAFCKLLHFLEGFENLTILNLDNCLRARKKDHGDERKTPGEAISHFVNRAHSPLQCISLAGSYGGDILQPFMRDLSENVSLRELNISNNHLDDWGGMWIAKLLRTRCGLRFLAVDGNRLGLSSCQAIATSLEKNVTLLYLDFIWTDYQHKVTLYSANRQKKYRTSLSLIQHHLWRNRATSKEVYYPSLKLLMEGKPLSEGEKIEVKNKRRCAFGASEEKANPPASFSPQRQASMLSPRAKPKSPKRAPSPVAVVPTPTPTPKEVVSSSSSSSSSSSVSAAASSGSAENVMSIFDDLDEPMPPPLPVKLGEVFSIEGESDEEDAESKKKDLVAPVSAAATAAAAATSPPASRGRGALPTPGGAQKGGGRGMQRAMSVMSTSSAAAQQQKQSSTMSPNRASMTRQQSEVANLRKSAASRPQAPTPPKGGSAISSTSSTGLGPLPPTAAPPPPTSTSGGQKEKKEKTSLSSGPPPSAAPPPPSAAPPPPPPAAAPPPPPPVSASLPPMNKNRNAMLSSISDFKKGKLKKVKESDKRDFSSATASSKGGGGGGGSGGSGGGGSGTSRRPPAKPSPMDELQAKINARNKK